MQRRLLVSVVALFALATSAFAVSSAPMNPFGDSIAALDRVIQQITLSPSSNSSTAKFVPAPNVCNVVIAAFETANPTIASLNAKIQDYTQSFFLAQLDGLAAKAQKVTENTRFKVNAPVTPFFDFHFHELCAAAGGRVCAAKLEMEIKITTSPRTIKLEIETSAARCIPATQKGQQTEASDISSSKCMSHDNLASLEEEIVSMCESMGRAGVDVKQCEVSAHCGFQSRGPTIWIAVGIPVIVGIFAIAMVVMLIRRVQAFVAASHAGCTRCNNAPSSEHKYERVETESSPPLVMVIPTSTPTPMPMFGIQPNPNPAANYPVL